MADEKSIFEEFLQSNFQVSDHEWDLMQDYGKSLELSKGEYFVREGRICRHLGFIAEGVMRYVKFEESGEETTCYFVCENDCVADPASFDAQKPSTMNIQAITDCVLITLSYDAHKKLLVDLPRYREVVAGIDRKTTMDLMRQRDWLMNRDAASKYRYFVEHYPHILKRVPLGHIASFLDITQQSLSRLRKQSV
jgi:CRP-like cAMP-binding protein